MAACGAGWKSASSQWRLAAAEASRRRRPPALVRQSRYQRRQKPRGRSAACRGASHGPLRDCRYLLHDRGTKYTQSFRAIIASDQVEPLLLPARSPNLNAYAERWVRSVKEECLSKVILFGEHSLPRALSNYVDHFHAERNHQGKGNVLLFPRS